MSNYYNSETLLEQQSEIVKLTSERDELKLACRNKDFAIDELNSELDALKAQAEELITRIIAAERVEQLLADAPDLTFAGCLSMFPEEFADRDAEVAKAAYLHALNKYARSMPSCEFINVAEIYANQLRQQAKVGE